MSQWYHKNLLKGNFSKYQIISFGSNQKNKELQVKMASTVVVQKPELKLLVSRRVGVISRIGELIPTPAKLQIVKSAILPHLTYCQLIWHFCRASDTRKLEKFQERAQTNEYHRYIYIYIYIWPSATYN